MPRRVMLRSCALCSLLQAFAARGPDRTCHAPFATMDAEEEAMDLDVASDGDLTSCEAEWSSDEEAARMDILLRNAFRAIKVGRAKPKTTPKSKRRRFSKLIRKFGPLDRRGERMTSPTELLPAPTDW